MTEDEVKNMRAKIYEGIELAYQRLLISKQKEDGELAISRDGKVVRVKASDLIKLKN
jgi:hypothetical protein